MSPWPTRSIQVDSTGTSVLESTNEEIIANPTASESGTNSWRPTPDMKSDGMNTDKTQSIERNRAMTVFWHASMTARAFDMDPHGQRQPT